MVLQHCLAKNRTGSSVRCSVHFLDTTSNTQALPKGTRKQSHGNGRSWRADGKPLRNGEYRNGIEQKH